MFDSGFAEAVYNQGIFPEDEPSAFDALIKWIYTGKLPAMMKRVVLIHGVGEETRTIWDPIDVCCLADKLCLVELIIATMDVWIKALKEKHCMPSCEVINTAYLSTQAGSPPRRFISRMVFWAEALYLRDKTDSVLRATFLSMIKAQDPLGEMQKDFFEWVRRKKSQAFVDPPAPYFVHGDTVSSEKSQGNDCMSCSHEDLSEIHSLFPE